LKKINHKQDDEENKMPNKSFYFPETMAQKRIDFDQEQ